MKLTEDMIPKQKETHATSGAFFSKFHPRNKSTSHVVASIWIAGRDQVSKMTGNHGALKILIMAVEGLLSDSNPMCSHGVIIGNGVRVEHVHANRLGHPSMEIVAVLVGQEDSNIIGSWGSSWDSFTFA